MDIQKKEANHNPHSGATKSVSKKLHFTASKTIVRLGPSSPSQEAILQHRDSHQESMSLSHNGFYCPEWRSN